MMPAKTRGKVFIQRKHCAPLSEEEMNFWHVDKFPIIFVRRSQGRYEEKKQDSEQSTVTSLRDKPAAESQVIKTSPNVSAWT